jgi:hypothetical protein
MVHGDSRKQGDAKPCFDAVFDGFHAVEFRHGGRRVFHNPETGVALWFIAVIMET